MPKSRTQKDRPAPGTELPPEMPMGDEDDTDALEEADVPASLDEQLAQARELVLDTITGVLKPEQNAHLFEDDVLMFAVERIENNDPGWLINLLADEKVSATARALTARITTSKALAETRARLVPTLKK